MKSAVCEGLVVVLGGAVTGGNPPPSVVALASLAGEWFFQTCSPPGCLPGVTDRIELAESLRMFRCEVRWVRKDVLGFASADLDSYTHSDPMPCSLTLSCLISLGCAEPLGASFPGRNAPFVLLAGRSSVDVQVWGTSL